MVSIVRSHSSCQLSREMKQHEKNNGFRQNGRLKNQVKVKRVGGGQLLLLSQIGPPSNQIKRGSGEELLQRSEPMEASTRASQAKRGPGEKLLQRSEPMGASTRASQAKRGPGEKLLQWSEPKGDCFKAVGLNATYSGRTKLVEIVSHATFTNATFEQELSVMFIRRLCLTLTPGELAAFAIPRPKWLDPHMIQCVSIHLLHKKVIQYNIAEECIATMNSAVDTSACQIIPYPSKFSRSARFHATARLRCSDHGQAFWPS
jgi:hypothetical protein